MADAPANFLATEDGEFNGNIHAEIVSLPLLKRMADMLDDLSPDETIGFSNGIMWFEVATVEEIRRAAYAGKGEL